MIGAWQASIAHADFADWVTVAAYLLGSLLSAKAAGRAMLARQPRESIFWRITAVLLVFLAINELLDLQTLLTAIGRANAQEHGWYGVHRTVQYYFIAGLGVVAFVAGLGMLWLTRRAHASIRCALVGLVFIGLFVLIRAASFHHADDILGSGWQVLTWGSIQELLGIAIVAVAAYFYTRSGPDRAKRQRKRSANR